MSNERGQGPGHPSYFTLDNSAIFLASATTRASPFVYRLSCVLDEPIRLPDMELAFSAVIERFPAFKTELRPGVFWYYLEPLSKPVRLQPDSRYPAEYHRLRKWDRYLFRVRLFGPRISCEFHHSLTDGTGALAFLRSLVAEYLRRRGVKTEDWEGIARPGQAVDPAEYEDAYRAFDPGKLPLPPREGPAFHIPGKRYAQGEYRSTTGRASVALALKAAKERGVSLTELLAACHLAALQGLMEANQSKKRPIRIQVPVNMRKYHASSTLRNFFLFVPVDIDPRLGRYDFPEILTRVSSQMRLGLNAKELDRQIRRNAGSARNAFLRLVPLPIKNFALKIVSLTMASRPYSGSLSNMGAVPMPEAFASRILRFDFLPSRDRATGANVGVISWRDELSITVGSLVVERDFEKAFFRAIMDAGIAIELSSNI